MDLAQVGAVGCTDDDRADQGADTHIQSLEDILFLVIDRTEEIVAGKVITAEQTISVLQVVEVGRMGDELTLQLVIWFIQEAILWLTDMVDSQTGGQPVLYHIGSTGGEVREDARIVLDVLQGLVGHLPVVRIVLILEDQITSQEIRVDGGLHTQADELTLRGTDRMGVDEVEIIDLISTRRHVIV